MKTLQLHPVYHGFDDETRDNTQHVYEFSPDHLPWLLRGEYRFLRQEGASRRVARWHVHRMIAMLSQPFGWTAQLQDDWPEPIDASEGELILVEAWSDNEEES